MRHRHFILILAYALAVLSAEAQTPNIAALERSAQGGDAKAQFDLAQAYWEGTGVSKDSTKGLEWLRKSASQGYAGAEVTLGVLYQNGVQVPKDPHEAAKWFRKAARQSDKDPKHAQTAQADLGALAVQGSITVSESDWRAPEPGSESVQPVKNAEVKSVDGNTTEVKNAEVKNAQVKNNAGNSKAAPFSLAEVETGLTGGITPKRMTTLVGQYGVDFTLSASARTRLTNDGADDPLLQTIASSKR